MSNSKPYKESTGQAIQKKKKREVTLKDIREWDKKRSYKEDTGITVNAMMESAMKDPYVDENRPSNFLE